MFGPSVKSRMLSELLPFDWLSMKCQTGLQMDGWLRVRGLQRRFFLSG